METDTKTTEPNKQETDQNKKPEPDNSPSQEKPYWGSYQEFLVNL